MNGYIRHTMKFEDSLVVSDEVIDCVQEKYTSLSIQVLGDTPIMVNNRPWTKDDGILTIQLEAPNLLDYKVNITFTNDTDKRVILNSSRLIDSVFIEVNKTCTI